MVAERLELGLRQKERERDVYWDWNRSDLISKAKREEEKLNLLLLITSSKKKKKKQEAKRLCREVVEYVQVR